MGRSTALRNQDADGAFVGFPEPLPVGTRLTLKIGEAVRDARVEEVVESPDPAVAGMRVRFIAEGAAAAAADLPGPPAAATPADAAPDAPADEGGGEAGTTNGTHQAESGGGGGRRRRKRR